jgi:lycopene cyclase domain-containing protein
MAEYFPRIRLKDRQVLGVTIVLVIFLLVLAAFNINRAYTAVDFFFAALLLGWVYHSQKSLLSQFYLSFLVILVPFGLVNGILTGSFIEEPVVWYNDQENLGIRLGTIPFEDIFYGMSLVLMNYYLTATFMKMANRRKTTAL